ncbi:hypothetical protein JOQ06_024410 [Pogonophryne albipinna]|uniref:Transposase n=1 Tax=Pogonophryne albipinna TaxID=1090488 RepID=A0AAD6A661_9TELE|nr:hypothetical protein JOQ06_024410 [Pogonophryne albipinna]
MSKTKSKQDKDPSSSSASVTLAELSSLLAEHRNAISADFKSSFEALTTTLDGLNSTVAGHGERIGSLEDNSNEVDRRLQHLENACSTLQQDNVLLKTKLADLEGRSRRQNIRIIGLPESLEGPRPTAFFSQLLVDVFGKEVLSSPPELDRAHRSLAPKPAAGDKPRPVIVRLHRFQVKDLLIREARRRGELFYKEHKIRLYEDYSSDVLKERAEYKSSMAELYKRGYRPALLYTAKLRITLPNDEKTWIQAVLEADKFLQNFNNRIDLFISTNVNPDISAAAIWESCKAYLRGEIISYSAYQRKIAMENKATLSKDIAELQSKCVDTPDADLFKDLLTKKAEYDILTSNETAQSLLKTRHNYYEFGDKPTITSANIRPSPLLALFGVLPTGLSLPSYFAELVAFLTLLARRAILLRWKGPCPPSHSQWIKDALHFMRLEKIKYSLRFSEQKFYKIWQPFLEHVRSLQIDVDPDI